MMRENTTEVVGKGCLGYITKLLEQCKKFIRGKVIAAWSLRECCQNNTAIPVRNKEMGHNAEVKWWEWQELQSDARCGC